MPISEVEEKQQKHQLDREIRDMMSALTRRLADLHKKPTEGGGSTTILENDEDDHDDHDGVGIITMAGTNLGATMRSDLDLMSLEDNKPTANGQENDEQLLPPLTTYLNSNFQAINNSIMLGGSYSANDPGIHLDINDEYHEEHQGGAHAHKHGQKGKMRKDSAESSNLDFHSS